MLYFRVLYLKVITSCFAAIGACIFQCAASGCALFILRGNVRGTTIQHPAKNMEEKEHEVKENSRGGAGGSDCGKRGFGVRIRGGK